MATVAVVVEALDRAIVHAGNLGPPLALTARTPLVVEFHEVGVNHMGYP
jgi:hypothetical protein